MHFKNSRIARERMASAATIASNNWLPVCGTSSASCAPPNRLSLTRRRASDILTDTLQAFAAIAEKKRRKRTVRFSLNVLLEQAVSEGNVEELKSLAEEHGNEILNMEDSLGRPLAVRAVLEEQLEVLKFLIQNNVNLALADDAGWTPLHYAAAYNDVRLTTELINADSSLTNCQTYRGSRPVDVADSPQLVSLLVYANLLAFNSEIKELKQQMLASSMQTEDSQERAHLATCSDKTEKDLIRSITSLTGRKQILKAIRQKEDELGCSLLHLAAARNFPRLAWLLLQNSLSSPNCASANGHTPLHLAVYHNNVEMVSLLKEYSANVKAVSKNGLTPLDMSDDMFTLDVLSNV